MSFLTPLLLVGLPLAAIPILIHLINQRRFQTIDWGAMQFLLEANRMSRGYARIRRWIILALRTLAVAALIFVVSRPLASGWLGMASGSGADTTIVLVDRSPSMQQRGSQAVDSKLATGIRQLASTLALVDSKRWVLIDSASLTPQDLNSPEALSQAAVAPVSASANLPTLLQAAHDYIAENRVGQTEVWILSDLKPNDWDAGNGKWRVLRDSFLEFKQGVQFHLLAYPTQATSNIGVRVTDVRRQQTSDGASLLISLKLTRTSKDKIKLPLQFTIADARSEHVIEWEGTEYELRDYVLPIASDLTQGWGSVSVPADEFPADDQYYFVFAEPTPKKTVIVAEASDVPRPLRLAASISPSSSAANIVEVATPAQVASIVWDEVSLLVWQAPLPQGDAAKIVDAYVNTGGQVLLMPPAGADGNAYRGLAWGDWSELGDAAAVANWRGDEDLLARTQSGAALPVGELQVSRLRQLTGDVTKLAWLDDEHPLLVRVPTDRGGVYALATTVAPSDSSLATGGVVLYAMLQRALAAGAAERGSTRSLIAGAASGPRESTWSRLAGPADALSTESRFVEGVYKVDERLIAVNRSAAEDTGEVLAMDRVDGLFAGLDFDRVSDDVGGMTALAREVWRTFLLLMIAALVGEAVLCLPKPASAGGGAA